MKIICDAMLGKLAKYLRILGLDTEYASDIAEAERMTYEDETVYFLTKRQKRPGSRRCIYVASEKVRDQIKEIEHIIRPSISPERIMSRCLRCNVALVGLARVDAEQYVPEFVFHRYNDFKICPGCRRVYWKGSQAQHMLEWVEEMMSDHTKDVR